MDTDQIITAAELLGIKMTAAHFGPALAQTGVKMMTTKSKMTAMLAAVAAKAKSSLMASGAGDIVTVCYDADEDRATFSLIYSEKTIADRSGNLKIGEDADFADDGMPKGDFYQVTDEPWKLAGLYGDSFMDTANWSGMEGHEDMVYQTLQWSLETEDSEEASQ